MISVQWCPNILGFAVISVQWCPLNPRFYSDFSGFKAESVWELPKKKGQELIWYKIGANGNFLGSGDHPVGWGSSMRRGGGGKFVPSLESLSSWVVKRGLWDVPRILPGCPRPLGVFKKLMQKHSCAFFVPYSVTRENLFSDATSRNGFLCKGELR